MIPLKHPSTSRQARIPQWHRHRRRRPCHRHPLHNRHVRVLLRVLIVAAVVAALIYVEMSSRSGVLWRLMTFTYQANVVAAIYYLSTLFSARADGRAGVRGAVVLYVVVAGAIWN